MTNKSWIDLVRDCPLDISRIHSHYEQLDSYLPENVSLDNLNESKEGVLRARGYLNSMFHSLIQLLYDSSIFKKPEDKILSMWLTEDIKMYLGKLDEDRKSLLIKFDSPNLDIDKVGVSRISTYVTVIQTSCDIIYDSLLKATKEYKNNKDKDKDGRTFLYILFQILTVTMSIYGGIQGSGGKVTKRSALSVFPTSYRSLMSDKGGEIIKHGFEEDTGIKMSEIEENLEGLYDNLED